MHPLLFDMLKSRQEIEFYIQEHVFKLVFLNKEKLSNEGFISYGAKFVSPAYFALQERITAQVKNEPVDLKAALTHICHPLQLIFSIENFQLPPFSYSKKDTKINILSDLLSLCGAVLQSAPTGELVAAYPYPIATQESINIFDFSYTENCLNIEYDNLLVTDEKEINIFHEYDKESSNLYVYTMPFYDAEYIEIMHTSKENVKIQYIETELKEENERVEVKEGQATVQHPIHFLKSHEYQYKELSAPSFVRGQKNIYTENGSDYSLLELEYTYKRHVYKFENIIDNIEAIQVKIKV